jgi:hypothetical protein
MARLFRRATCSALAAFQLDSVAPPHALGADLIAGRIEKWLRLVPTMTLVVDRWAGGIRGSCRPAGDRRSRKGADRKAAEEGGVLAVG